ncbi:MAG TPA: prepilin-type N-terminal cleavage/methylation domain-containing protein [Leucothrix sp.]|nr:prepilin-type N-terminal cleavage/methylation domain-containing protein [Leucothrix sp.]
MKNHAKTTYKKKSAGFTLIELIVTVSIAAILMSIAVPSFKNMIDSNRLSTGTNELVSALILARSEALKRGQNVSVCAITDQRTCSGTDFATGWIVFVDCGVAGTKDIDSDCNGDGDSDDVMIDDDPIIKASSSIANMTITKNNAAHFLSYSFAGRLAGTGTTTFRVALKDSSSGDRAKEIVATRTGRLKTTDVIVQ